MQLTEKGMEQFTTCLAFSDGTMLLPGTKGRITGITFHLLRKRHFTSIIIYVELVCCQERISIITVCERIKVCNNLPLHCCLKMIELQCKISIEKFMRGNLK